MAENRESGEYFVNEEEIKIEIDGVLDLHHFSPKDLKSLIPTYLQECVDLGISEVRIVHGKGKGHLRRSTHALLERSPLVSSFRMGSQFMEGSWGATIVTLKMDCKDN